MDFTLTGYDVNVCVYVCVCEHIWSLDSVALWAGPYLSAASGQEPSAVYIGGTIICLNVQMYCALSLSLASTPSASSERQAVCACKSCSNLDPAQPSCLGVTDFHVFMFGGPRYLSGVHFLKKKKKEKVTNESLPPTQDSTIITKHTLAINSNLSFPS